MNIWQKIAWYNIIVITISLSLTAGAITVIALIAGMPKAFAGLGFMGFCGLMGFSPVLFKKDKSKVTFDERDRAIGIKAGWAGFGASYCFFIIVCMTTWAIYGSKGTVSVQMLPLMVLGGFIVSEIVRSITILVQYGRGGKENE